MKKIIAAILSVAVCASVCLSAGCGGTGNVSTDEFAYRTEEKADYMDSVYLTDYITALGEEELADFAAEGNSNRQGTGTKGIAVSSYYTTRVNGEEAYTYMVFTAETTPHSFVLLDVSEDRFEGGKTLEIELSATFDVEKAIVLPEKLGVEPTVSEGRTVRFTVSDHGTYTLIVNDERAPQNSYTLFVRRPEKVEVPYGYTLIEYKPGLHFVDGITLTSNTILYLHAGALLVATGEPGPGAGTGTGITGFINTSNAENVKIVGHGVIDLSRIPWGQNRGIYMNVCNNVEIDGVTLINSATWSMMYSYCSDLTIRDCIVFGCRQNSDGYAICSSRDVVVSDCFARSGDDLFEVKTYGDVAENILFENCIAWPDNCRGFGIIQETNSDIKGVTYRNCSLLYQLNDWSEKMASFVITAGESGNVSEILFEDCDLFYSSVYAIRFSVGANDETSGVSDFSNTITDVTFRNCDFKYPASSRGIVKFRNVTDNPSAISGILFENVTFGGVKLTSFADLNPTYEGYSAEETPAVTVK